MNIAQAMAQARALGVARLDAQLLLAWQLGRPRAWLLAHTEHELTSDQQVALSALLKRRADEVPLAYLTGEREFFGLSLHVTADVLVPRPETELLVEWALELLPRAPSSDVLDLGTGSGAIALSLAHAAPATQVTATDISAAALAVAQGNAALLKLPVEFLLGRWWQAVADRRWGLVVSNPPYVAGNDPHLPALRHEPRGALTPEGDGLGALTEIIAGAAQHLLPGAWLLLEHGHDQADAVCRLLAEQGFEQIQTRRDLALLWRCSGGQWPLQG